VIAARPWSPDAQTRATSAKKLFVMAGRLVQGQWNMAFFETTSGKKRARKRHETSRPPTPSSAGTARACFLQRRNHRKKRKKAAGAMKVYSVEIES
jgi:hypothetical protein